MTWINLQDAHLAFGDVALLDGAGMTLDAGERVGLIGRNGTGKSSLLKVLAEQLALDDGSVTRQRDLSVAYVPQEPVLNEEGTVFDEVSETFKEIRVWIAALGNGTGAGDLQNRIDAADGWNWQARTEAVIHGFHLEPDWRVSALSGGQRRRLALARAWVGRPDILLLDEPTNHLDLETIGELEELLLRFTGSAVVITHDRAFLDRIATRIVELDRGRIASFPGNFSRYQVLKAEQMHQEALANARADKLLSQEEAWIRQGVEARRTRAQDRVNRLMALRASRAARRDAVGQVHMKVDEQVAGYQGKLVAQLDDVSFSYGDTGIASHLSTTILRGDKVGLIGPNGAGKTTLLKLILGEIAPQSGRVSRGANLQVAYYDQMRSTLDPEATLEDFISPGSEWIEVAGQRQHVKSYLRDFLFSPARARSPVRTLSGGERARLLLARLFALPANVLVLDEPTNDLDIDTLELLEELLQNYGGTVFLVSHDRTFLDNVVTSTLAWDGPASWRGYPGGIADWQAQSARWQALRSPEDIGTEVSKPTGIKKTEPPVKEDESAPRKRKLSYKESRELEALPARIEALETEQEQIRTALADGTLYKTDLERAVALQARDGEIEEELMTALERWETLGG